MSSSNMNLSQLLQPELLTEDDIRNILISRCIRIDNLELLNKEQLLNIYNRVITPLNQRSRKESHRNLSEQQLKMNENSKDFHKTLDSQGYVKRTIRINSNTENDNGAKKIKLANNKAENGITNKVHLKRTYSYENLNDEDVPKHKKTRQKICWP